MKRILVLVLVLTLALSACSVSHASFEGTVNSYAFDLHFRLNPSAFPARMREKMEGYADFANSARLTGVFSVTEIPGYMDLQASLYPSDSSDAPLSFHVYGTPAILVITSPLLGNEVLFLNTPGLMAFGSKTYSHLSLPLQYLALVLPYTWELAFDPLTTAWREEIGFGTDPREISAQALQAVADRWAFALTDDLYLNEWLTCVTQADQEASMPLASDVENLPAYLTDSVAAGGDLSVVEAPGGIAVKNSRDEVLFQLWDQVDYYGWMADLPVTASGYKPYGSWERTEFEDTFHFDFQAYLRSADGSRPDLLTFRSYGDNLPAAWPVDTDFNAHLFLMGSLFPNIALSAVGSCREDGSFSVGLFKPIVPGTDDVEFFRIEGSAVPTEPADLPDYAPAEWMYYRNVLSLSDVSMGEFVENVTRPLIGGLVRFLIDVPVSFCQSVMDDLTDSGILGLVLSK